jgi:hypothetical protein
LWVFILPFFCIGLFVSVKYVMGFVRRRRQLMSGGSGSGSGGAGTREEYMPLRPQESI